MTWNTLPGSRDIHAVHQRSMPQLENGCAAFTVAVLLGGLGFESFDDLEISQDLVAQAAGMVALDDAVPFDVDPGVELQHRLGFAREYLFPLERTTSLDAVGTSAAGIERAVESISQGRMVCVPVSGRTAGGAPLPGAGLLALTRALVRSAGSFDRPQVLFNYDTSFLTALMGPGQGLAHVLLGEERQPCEWQVGHVTSLAGVLETPDGTEALVIRDSSPAFGWRGYHVETAEDVARALARGDTAEGGFLVLCRPDDRPAVDELVKAILPDADLRLWDNGSPSEGVS